MPSSIFSQQVQDAIAQIKAAALTNEKKNINVDGVIKTIDYPYPSPVDWRDNWIYFILVDRFNNPGSPPLSETTNPTVAWNERYNFRQGGTINGVRAQLDYLATLGVTAIWLSPLLKNSAPGWEYNYHGYGAQDFLTIDGRFGSDGTSATAEDELIKVVEEAHARGIYVIMDIVLNHTARVFDYDINNATQVEFQNDAILNGPWGSEQNIQWLNGFGFARSDWENDLPPSTQLSPDDAIWPDDMQRKDFFRRRGTKSNGDKVSADGFVKGDFGAMRQLVVEYMANADTQQELRKKYGLSPVLNILVQAYRYMIARFDIDGFRIDTVKYVRPDMVETFGNAIREFALSIGKRNFFTFGEVYDDEATLQKFIGRNSTDGFGIDAALDFPLFYKLPQAAKSFAPVETIKKVFDDRKALQKSLLSSHGEAGKYFVSFLDNHDQNERFNHPGTPVEQVLIGIAVMFCLQGIPCLYYGTEQGLEGTTDQHPSGNPNFEFVREALWGNAPNAFDIEHPIYKDIQLLSFLRTSEPSLLYGRLYFREVSGNGRDFGFSNGTGGIIAFSRILADREVLIVANTNTSEKFEGSVIVDIDTNRSLPQMKIAYSNKKTDVTRSVTIIEDANFIKPTGNEQADAAALFVALASMEVQVWVVV